MILAIKLLLVLAAFVGALWFLIVNVRADLQEILKRWR
jgi:hypothetical protein